MLNVVRPLAFAAASLCGTFPVLAGVSASLNLSISNDAEVTTTQYACEGQEAALMVRYINAAPNFLAVVPIGGEDILFTNVISASGAKYVAGQYEWWSKGADATLHDVTEGLDAAPVLTCAENVQTP